MHSLSHRNRNTSVPAEVVSVLADLDSHGARPRNHKYSDTSSTAI